MHVEKIIKLDKPLELGNNFTLERFFAAIEANELVELYEEVHYDDPEITIKGKGIYGDVQIYTCGSDVIDHLKPLYDDVIWNGVEYVLSSRSAGYK